jgi:acetyltransferase-like isoleucine patch superfamily enzyme
MSINPLDTPWKVINEVQRLLVSPYMRVLFGLYGITWQPGWKFYGIPMIQKHRRSEMHFGPGLGLRSASRSNPLSPSHAVMLCTWQAGAVLQIGAHFGMTGGTICAAEKITIGNNVAVGANCTIIDTDFHPLDPAYRMLHPQDAVTAPISIEDDVFIGMNCIVLKGVTIGHSSVIGAGSVVTKNIPARSVAAGNPAKVLRSL